MRASRVFLLLAALAMSGLSALAQDPAASARDEFNSYERNFSQVETPKPASKPVDKKPVKPTGRRGKKPPPVKPPKPVIPPVTGLPGMKIWLEKQAKCSGAFLLTAPTAIFKTGDCVRARFRLNFEGYLTILNYGSSGSLDKIYPAEKQSNKILPKTDHFLPDNRGWEFYNKTGNENLFFVVSKLPQTDDLVQEIERRWNANAASSQESELYDRDLKPRTEKDEIFILAGEARLEKPLIFRLVLKHR